MIKLVEGKFGFQGSGAHSLIDGGISVPIPTRALNSFEMEHAIKLKEFLSTQRLPQYIFEINKLFSIKTAGGLDIPEVSNYIKEEIEKKTESGGLRFSIFHPLFSKSVQITESLNRKLIDVQLQSDIDVITIRDQCGSYPYQLEKKIIESLETIKEDSPAKTPMLTLYISESDNSFARKVDLAVKHGMAIDIIYASPLSYYANYRYLSQIIKRNKVYVHASEVEKTLRTNGKTAVPHMLNMFGIGSSSTKNKWFLNPTTIPTQDKVHKKIPSRFDAVSMGHLTQAEHMKRHGDDLKCSCDICKGRTLKEFFDIYEKSGLLSEARKVHEVNQSFADMQHERTSIISGKQFQYLRSKDYLVDGIKIVFGFDLKNQGTLKSN